MKGLFAAALVFSFLFVGLFAQVSPSLLKSAQRGEADAQYAVGNAYLDSLGVPKDGAEALKWYEKAAAQGHAGAQFRLGGMYLSGDGVPKDLSESAKWYGKAAMQGQSESQLMLGLAYNSGAGVVKDLVAAHAWVNLSTVHGGIHAKDALRKIESKMSQEQLAEATAMARELFKKIKGEKSRGK